MELMTEEEKQQIQEKNKHILKPILTKRSKEIQKIQDILLEENTSEKQTDTLESIYSKINQLDALFIDYNNISQVCSELKLPFQVKLNLPCIYDYYECQEDINLLIKMWITCIKYNAKLEKEETLPNPLSKLTLELDKVFSKEEITDSEEFIKLFSSYLNQMEKFVSTKKSRVNFINNSILKDLPVYLDNQSKHILHKTNKKYEI